MLPCLIPSNHLFRDPAVFNCGVLVGSNLFFALAEKVFDVTDISGRHVCGFDMKRIANEQSELWLDMFGL